MLAVIARGTCQFVSAAALSRIPEWFAMDVFPDWGNLQHGDSISLVVQLMVRCDNQSIVTTLERPCRQVCVIGTFPSTDATTFCVLDAKVVQVKPLTVELGGASTVCPVPACDRKQLNQVIELCCGIGAFSSVCHPLGMNVVAGVDTNPVWSPLFAACHEGSAVFLHSECGEIDLVRRLLALDGLEPLHHLIWHQLPTLLSWG